MSGKNLNGLEKAAVLLKSLPADVVEKVLRHLDARQAGLVRSELAKVSERPDANDLLATILDEATEVMTSSQVKAAAGPLKLKVPPTPAPSEKTGAAKPIPKGQNAAAKVDIRLAGNTQEKQAVPENDKEPEGDPLSAIAAIPADVLALALDSENTRTISLLMNYLDVEIAGEIYKRLTPVKRKEVSMRFTEQATVNEQLLRRIAQAVLRKCQSLQASPNTASVDPAAREKRMASLLRALERTERMEMITVLEQADAELAARVKAMLYQFEDILRMQNVSVQKLLTEIDTKSLALALTGAADDLREKLFNNLSKRAQESLKEEIELSGTVPTAKVRQAQQTIADAIQRLDQRGELVLIE